MSQEYEQSVELVQENVVRNLAAAVMLAALTAVLAQLSVPTPANVPFSLQPFGVFFAALLLGPLWGGFSMLLYLVVGVAGAPVFSNANAGLGYVLGGTGGFLVGFVVAAVVAGAIAHRRLEPRSVQEIAPAVAAVALGVSLIPMYAIGVPWLSYLGGNLTLIGAAEFMAPFFGTDIVKAAITVAMVASGHELLEQL